MRALRTALAVAILASASNARAAVCSISATGPAFGAYDPLNAAPLDVAGSIQYLCNAAIQIAISTGSSGTFANRSMQGGAGPLLYNLFLDPARTQVWGDGTNGTGVLTNLPSGNRSVPIYGRIPPLQNAAEGSYSDSLIVTITF